MCLKALSLCLLAVALSGLVQEGDSACKELQPVVGFKDDFGAGRTYWILQKIAYDQQVNAKCMMSYTFVEGNVWTFIDNHQNNDSYDVQFVKMVGVMDTPGHWNITTAHPDGTPFTISLTAIAGMSKKYMLLYSCNPDNGEYALWFFNHERVSPEQIELETLKGVVKALISNNLTTPGAFLIDNTHCVCK